MRSLFRKIFTANFDVFLFLSVLMIFGIGLLFLYSTSPDRSATLTGNFALRQLLWMAFALFAFFGVFSLPFRRFYDLAYWLYGFSLFLLVLVLFLGRSTRLGAQRWLEFGPMVFQPSELIKITFVLAIARFLSGKDLAEEPGKGIFGAVCLALLPAFLILKEPHLGTAFILFPILFGILYVAGLRRRYFVWTFILLLIASPLGWLFLRAYQKARFLVFMNPNLDPLGAGYTIIQSRISIGSGWLFGKGLFEGTQNRLHFLPERHTDFIFSVVGEEWGFLGGAFLILLYLFLIKRGLAIAGRARDPFARLVAVGLTMMLFVHIFVNIAMTMGFLPVVGLPLPFVSYGGSWLVSCMVAIALILGVGSERDF